MNQEMRKTGKLVGVRRWKLGVRRWKIGDGFVTFLVSWLESPTVRFTSRYARFRSFSCFPTFLINPLSCSDFWFSILIRKPGNQK